VKRGQWKPVFLEALKRTAMVTAAAEEAQISRRTAYDARERDAEFAARWDAIWEKGTEQLEREAFRRAAIGTLKPVFQQGRQVGEIREYSDNLLMFLLKGRKPETYRDNSRVQHVGAGGTPLEVTVSLDAGQRSSLRELLRARPVKFDAGSGVLEGEALEDARRELAAGESSAPDG
jgi:hypothetical protein